MKVLSLFRVNAKDRKMAGKGACSYPERAFPFVEGWQHS